MSLPLESFACGNLSTGAFALLLSKEEDQEYHNLVWPRRTAIKQINHDHVNNVQSGLPYLCNLNKGIDLIYKEEMSYCSFTSWCKFPIYEVDYGWGKPISVCIPPMPEENVVILFDTTCGEGIEAWISMFENKKALLPDELLSLAAR
ncbi:hypothetical protein ACH5RR_008857 [Cinchona calisaya]|uniref:Uncharacterized protein n=1 Tax=Cinchona calisaya TaxID=153742 RepID=A0ABD3ACH7_9GENT